MPIINFTAICDLCSGTHGLKDCAKCGKRFCQYCQDYIETDIYDDGNIVHFYLCANDESDPLNMADLFYEMMTT